MSLNSEQHCKQTAISLHFPLLLESFSIMTSLFGMKKPSPKIENTIYKQQALNFTIAQTKASSKDLESYYSPKGL